MSEVKSLRLMRLKEVMALVPLGRSTIYDRMAAGTFPQSIDCGGGVVCWREFEIEEWIRNLPQKGTKNNLGVVEGVAQKANAA